MRNIKILSTGKYLPARVVHSSELDEMMNLEKGWTEKKSGVTNRRYIDPTFETNAYMGARAAEQALHNANLKKEDIDCIISASGSYQQPLPCGAALIQKELEMSHLGVPCFDINSTCLSFVTALDTISYLVEAGRYNRVLIISSEIASAAINYNQKESAVLFGDAAVAVIVEKAKNTEDSHILNSHMVTFSEGANLTEVRGGGTNFHPRNYSEETKEEFLFHMDGKGVFKLSSKKINEFVTDLLSPTRFEMKHIDLVIPHQASGMAMRIMRKKLGIAEDKFMDIIGEHGNTIASSIPLALHEAIVSGRLKRGQRAMLIGTSAGLSIGGIVFEY